MQLNFKYIEKHDEVQIISQENDSVLFNSLKRLLQDHTESIIQNDLGLNVLWRDFLIMRTEIASFCRLHSIDTVVDGELKLKIKESREKGYSSVKSAIALTTEEIGIELLKVGFSRKLTSNQMSNVSKLSCLISGATFSVPGAGKTTEALAFFSLNSRITDRLLIVAPKNAFSSWEEQLSLCLPGEKESFCRLRGGAQIIRKLLQNEPKYMLITYQQFPKVKELIRNLLKKSDVYMFLDESHRIKNGKMGLTGETILDVAHLPMRKLILSGTPMPQSVKDLIPQFAFLYPEVVINENNVIDLFKPIYVRTTKGQLGIPPVEHRLITLKMDNIQRNVYEVLKSEIKRQLLPMLSDRAKYSLRDIGKHIIKIIQFTSNPALLSKDLDYVFDNRLGELLLNNHGPKIEYACKRARELSRLGKKVIIWSSFVENVELISSRLTDLGADFIHGGVDAGDEEESDTREWKIKEFHNNPEKYVLVANPAAASEGISLHTVCQYAIYIDRTFNAAHYLQSEDRIHRLGLTPEQSPYVEIIECENSVDQVVRYRLESKIKKMSDVLNDESLVVDVIPYDFEIVDEIEVSDEDVNLLIKHLFGETTL